MDEQQWLESTGPRPMLQLLWGSKISERKKRLFAIACCRSIWHLLADERSRQAIEVAERYADNQATVKELERAAESACSACRAEGGEEWWEELHLDSPYRASLAAYNIALPMGWWGGVPAFVAPNNIVLEIAANERAAGEAQSALLRDIFGNPFRPLPTLTSALLTANDGLVVLLARAAYDERILPEGHLDNARLAVLTDALEEAGFEDEEMLSHLRKKDAVHVRGCAAVDWILGRS